MLDDDSFYSDHSDYNCETLDVTFEEFHDLEEQSFTKELTPPTQAPQNEKPVATKRHSKRKQRLDPDCHLVLKKNILVDRFWPSDGKPTLPEGWIYTRHVTGVLVYMHKATRVVTLAPPYMMPKGHLRSHSIPIFAIPCYMYRHMKEREEQMKGWAQQQQQSTMTPSFDSVTEGSHVTDSQTRTDLDETTDEFKSESTFDSLFSDEPSCKRTRRTTDETPEMTLPGLSPTATTATRPLAVAMTANDTVNEHQLKEYFQRGFDFKDIEVHRFGSSAARIRHYREMRKVQIKETMKKTLSDTDVIRFQIPSGVDANGEAVMKDGMVRIANKTYVGILHEYSMAVCKKAATFQFCEPTTGMETAPYRCQLFINNMMYGVGEGSTKKIAKMLAARNSLHNVIQDFDKLESQIKDYESMQQAVSQQQQIQIQMEAQESVQSVTSGDSRGGHGSHHQRGRKGGHHRGAAGRSSQPMPPSTASSERCDDLVPPVQDNASVRLEMQSKCPFSRETKPEAVLEKPPMVATGEEDDEDGVEQSVNNDEDDLLETPNESSSTSAGIGATTNVKWDEEFFDQLEITNPHSTQHLTRANLPPPRALLLECLKRNFIPASELREEFFAVKHGKEKRKCVLKLRNFSVEMPCTCNRDGRQLASQSLLSQMYPTMRHWGPILRLFGPGSLPENKTDLSEIQKLQMREKGAVKLSLIGMLKTKMLQLADQWESMPEYGKGKFGLFNGPVPSIILHPDAKNLEMQIIGDIAPEEPL